MTADSAARVARILEELEHFGLKLGLERTRRVLAELGSPESELPVVLVAGTNGKGSTSAWIASIATAAGYRSGLFTSPHLERVEERLRIDGVAVPTERLEERLDEVLEASDRAGGELVTYFEAMTAAALCHFSRERVDLAVLEVGLGGRLDATNTTSPLLSVITQISLDHQRQLGETLSEIAAEKAGILRAGRPAVSSASDPEARRALESAAAALGAELSFSDDLAEVVSIDSAGGTHRVGIRTSEESYDLEPRLAGRHQVENLALAVCAAERLAREGFPWIDRRAIERGVAACDWPGRLERVQVDERCGVLLDAAHNPAGLEALRAHLSSLEEPFRLVFGMLREKVEARVVARLWDEAETVFVTSPDSDRALPPDQLIETVGERPTAIVDDPGEALERAIAEGGLVVVCGSLYLVGALRTWLRDRYGVPIAGAGLFESLRTDSKA